MSEHIVRELLRKALVPPKILANMGAFHFGVPATSINIDENMLQKFGEACFKAGQEDERNKEK